MATESREGAMNTFGSCFDTWHESEIMILCVSLEV